MENNFQQQNQQISVSVIRCSILNAIEYLVLNYISFYKDEDVFCLKIAAKDLRISDRHLRRIITNLVSKGFLIKKYNLQKKISLKIINVTEQNKIVSQFLESHSRNMS